MRCGKVCSMAKAILGRRKGFLSKKPKPRRWAWAHSHFPGRIACHPPASTEADNGEKNGATYSTPEPKFYLPPIHLHPSSHAATREPLPPPNASCVSPLEYSEQMPLAELTASRSHRTRLVAATRRDTDRHALVERTKTRPHSAAAVCA